MEIGLHPELRTAAEDEGKPYCELELEDGERLGALLVHRSSFFFRLLVLPSSFFFCLLLKEEEVERSLRITEKRRRKQAPKWKWGQLKE
uniref:Uncharacterized protein n=1 Tax=Cucumis melo TaxID=3656 RepID=A0A9I9E7I8_CUCME